MKPQTQEKISQLQNLEQNMNALIAQKQQFQGQNLEIENAIQHIDPKRKVFQIIGNIMVESKGEDVLKDLNEKKEVVELRLKSIDKQEGSLRDRAAKLQEEVLQEMKEDGRKKN